MTLLMTFSDRRVLQMASLSVSDKYCTYNVLSQLQWSDIIHEQLLLLSNLIRIWKDCYVIIRG